MNTFKLLRKEKKLTQSELAKQLDIDQTTVSKWELDKALPDIATLIKLAKFFDVSTDYLLSLSEYYYPDKLTNNNVQIETYNNEISSDETRLLEIYRTLSPDMRSTLWSLLETWCPSSTRKNKV